MPAIPLVLLLLAGVAPPQPPKARSSGPARCEDIPVPESRLKKHIPCWVDDHAFTILALRPTIDFDFIGRPGWRRSHSASTRPGESS